MARTVSISGDRILIDGIFRSATLVLEHGRIAEIGPWRSSATYDAGPRHVLPGIVDIHGDAFERQLMPRPGVHFDPALALLDTDRQLITNGITTAFHAVTYSWEPGLRGQVAGRALKQAMSDMRGRLAADTKLHLRWETYNLDAVDEVRAWLEDGEIGLLAFNDHTPAMVDRLGKPEAMMKYAERTGLTPADFRELLEGVASRAPAVEGAIESIASAARDADVATASHDDSSVAGRAWYRSLECTISEFPQNDSTALAARAAGDDVVMGAPNVVRGGSHLALVSAADMVARGLCTILASDYYYPAMLRGAFRLARDGICSLPDAWRLVSENPARAARLNDRGAIEVGKRADLTIVEERGGALPGVAATFVAGQAVYLDGRTMERSGRLEQSLP